MSDHLAIILIGPPASGKTTFANNFIRARNHGIVSFSSDDVRKLLAKGNENIHPDHPLISGKDSALLKRRMRNVMKTGTNFIYDFTGNSEMWMAEAIPRLRSFGYTIVFIHLLVPLEQALKQNQIRARQTPEDFIRYSYKITQPMMKIYGALHPDAYYVIVNTNGKYVFYKITKNGLEKRKVDHYELM